MAQAACASPTRRIFAKGYEVAHFGSSFVAPTSGRNSRHIKFEDLLMASYEVSGIIAKSFPTSG